MTEETEQSSEGPLLKNRYKLGRVLGRGGMCIVYQAWDTRLQRNVAVKRLDPSMSEDAKNRARFDREGRALAQLSHPNLVTLIDRGSTDKEEYLVFEYVEGRSLKDMTSEAPLSLEDFGKIAGQVAEGLGAAHAQGIVHRDVKPQNILVDREGHAKVTDFGIATGPDWTRLTKAGSVIGSARYMSPEQVKSRAVDLRSDIYSFGAVMYEMLAGRPPFDGTSMPEIARQHLNSKPPSLSEIRPDVPAALEKVIMRCLEKAPEDRFGSMDELLGAFAGLGLYTPQRTTDVTASHHRLLGKKSEGDQHGVRTRLTAMTSSEARQQKRALARERRATRRVQLGIGAGVLVLLLILIIILAVTCGGVKAPKMVGLNISAANTEAAKSDINVTVVKVPSFDNPNGTVIAQNPAPGVELKDKKLTLSVATTPVPVKVTKVKAADPQGDNKENNSLLPNLTDGNKSTSWKTENYKSKSFAGIKTGVGVDFTLEGTATMIVVYSQVEGWKGQVIPIVSGKPGAPVATLNGTTSQTVNLSQGLTACRLWFTQLAPLTETRWGVDLTEVYFYR